MKPEAILDRLWRAVVALDHKGTAPRTREALAAGIPPARIIAEGLSKGMRDVGEKFKCGEMYMPEVLVSGDSAKVRAASEACLAAGVHILAPGCAIPARTPEENIEAMVRTAAGWKG